MNIVDPSILCISDSKLYRYRLYRGKNGGPYILQISFQPVQMTAKLIRVLSVLDVLDGLIELFYLRKWSQTCYKTLLRFKPATAYIGSFVFFSVLSSFPDVESNSTLAKSIVMILARKRFA